MVAQKTFTIYNGVDVSTCRVSSVLEGIGWLKSYRRSSFALPDRDIAFRMYPEQRNVSTLFRGSRRKELIEAETCSLLCESLVGGEWT